LPVDFCDEVTGVVAQVLFKIRASGGLIVSWRILQTGAIRPILTNYLLKMGYQNCFAKATNRFLVKAIFFVSATKYCMFSNAVALAPEMDIRIYKKMRKTTPP